MDYEKLAGLIKTRRSIRAFMKKPVEQDKVKRILEAGGWAPSAGNLQSVEFIVVTQKRKELMEICNGQEQVEEAPVSIVICCNMERLFKYAERGEELYSLQESGAVIQNMMLTAHSLGLATSWVGSFDEIAMKRFLDLPERVRPVAVIPVGYPSESGWSNRMPIEKKIHKEKY